MLTCSHSPNNNPHTLSANEPSMMAMVDFLLNKMKDNFFRKRDGKLHQDQNVDLIQWQ
jgi:hypothetical protein